jgi:hypothetical protein
MKSSQHSRSVLTAFVLKIVAAFEIRYSLLLDNQQKREISISAIITPDTVMHGPEHDSDVTPAIKMRLPPQPLAHEDFSSHHTSCCQNAGDFIAEEMCSDDPYMSYESSSGPEASDDPYMPGGYMPGAEASKDPYTVLGVSTNVTEQQLKRAYREMCLKHHPDKQGGATADFQRVATAYSTLLKKFEYFVISSDEEEMLTPCVPASSTNKSIARPHCNQQKKLRQSLPLVKPPATLSSPDGLHLPAEPSSIPKHSEKQQEPVSEQRDGRTARRNRKKHDSDQRLPPKNKTEPTRTVKNKLPLYCYGKSLTSGTGQSQSNAATTAKRRNDDGKPPIDPILRPRPPSYAPPLKLRVAMMRAKHAAEQGAAGASQDNELLIVAMMRAKQAAKHKSARLNDEYHRKAVAFVGRLLQ